MRKALNENPVAQIGLLAVLGIGVALLLMTRLGGGAAEEPAAPAPSSTAAGGTATAPSSAEAPTTADAVGEALEPAIGAPSVSSFDFVPSKGLPEDVVVAYAQDKAVVLLVMRRRGIEDQAIKRAVEQLRSRDDVAVFLTGAGKISSYSRITEGVSVSQVPALVVIKPRKLTDNVPTASVSYGFRGAPSIVQAVEDALYTGRQLPYYPE